MTMVKDEIDVLPYTLEHMIREVSFVFVMDNGSTDGTREWLDERSREWPDLYVFDDPEVGYYQSEKMTKLAATAGGWMAHPADWVVPFDADEWWYSPFGRIKDVLADFDGAVATAEIYDHRATALDPDDSNPITRMGWRTREPLPLHKVACRPTLPVTIMQGNHGASYPTQSPLVGQLVIRHFPIRSPEQMARKARNGAAAYAATDLPEDAGAHWRGWGRLSDEQLGEVFREHYWSAAPQEAGLIFDPCPQF